MLDRHWTLDWTDDLSFYLSEQGTRPNLPISRDIFYNFIKLTRLSPVGFPSTIPVGNSPRLDTCITMKSCDVRKTKVGSPD